MSLSSFFKSALSTPPTKEEQREQALIDAIYAGKDMAAHLVMRDGDHFSCVCGPIDKHYENPAHHHNFCPVGRFFAALEAIRKAAL